MSKYHHIMSQIIHFPMHWKKLMNFISRFPTKHWFIILSVLNKQILTIPKSTTIGINANIENAFETTADGRFSCSLNKCLISGFGVYGETYLSEVWEGFDGNWRLMLPIFHSIGLEMTASPIKSDIL